MPKLAEYVITYMWSANRNQRVIPNYVSETMPELFYIGIEALERDALRKLDNLENQIFAGRC